MSPKVECVGGESGAGADRHHSVRVVAKDVVLIRLHICSLNWEGKVSNIVEIVVRVPD